MYVAKFWTTHIKPSKRWKVRNLLRIKETLLQHLSFEKTELIAGPKMIIRDYSSPFSDEIRENKVIQLDRLSPYLIFHLCDQIENAV